MKLLQVGCFAAAAAQGSGDYDYGLDETRGENYEYYYDALGNKKRKKKASAYTAPTYSNSYDSAPVYDSGYDTGYDDSYTNDYYGKVYTSGKYAYAINCWPANFDTDKLMKKDTVSASTNDLLYERWDQAPMHYYGSEESPAKGGSGTQTKGEASAAASGLGGLYHYGWKNSDATFQENSDPSEWIHYHSARHAGCLYELSKFVYDAATYDTYQDAFYYNGYFIAATMLSPVAAVTDTSIVYVPNWLHFFNAHVLPGTTSIGIQTSPPSGGYVAGTRNARVVMANPQYEGLGYLNFIATYKVNGKVTGQDYLEFIDATEKTNKPDSTTTTYNTINSVATQHQDGIGGEWYFDGWMGTWTFTSAATNLWDTIYTSPNWAPNAGSSLSVHTGSVAISSFPHNELGKDFRFNLRILHKTEGHTSYYWYRVNTIVITFPDTVSYALYHDSRRATNFARTVVTNAIANSQLMNVKNAEERENIIPPLDLGTWRHNSFLRDDDLKRDETSIITASSDAHSHHRINGWLEADTMPCTPGTNCATWCSTAILNQNFCSEKFMISGLMNTYDERYGGQMGTIQEVWVQLSYAMFIEKDPTAMTDYLDYNVESPFPYLHFQATEILTVALACTTTDVHNGNQCTTTFAAGADNNHPDSDSTANGSYGGK